ncbi:conjugal transfer protein TraQ [Salmonella enterica subsp. enterica serovar Legon]|nr:conjugal transfer protein TraQ [Salmonella enterica subsp. enterica serovar Weybridge]EDS6807072.1 conjugal transfer protein TraQ [Salmonella enterica subsp. enterica serovar Legon]EDZ3589479.1 conjugal transfer protein TraQ [Salmonella enterica subsp. enterica serovar Wagenia]EHL5833746.1 conjugal transfer protein TraQ [Salmonella enterica]
MDALTAIENFASSIFNAGLSFLFVWGEFLGVVWMIILLSRGRADSPAPITPGKFVTGMMVCAMLVSLPSLINAGGAQFGFSSTTFDAISYVEASTFGAAAGAANAVLSLARLAGVGFALSGINLWRQSGLDGHTALSANESVSRGTTKFVAGVLLVFTPQVLNAIQASLGLAF